MKKSTFKKIAFTAVAIACGSAFAQFNSNINLSKQSWSTHEGEAYFYVTPPFGELELSACTFSHPEILSTSNEVKATNVQSMVVINEEKAKKLPAGDTTIVVQCGEKANHKANFIVKNILPTLAKPFAVLESVHDFSGFKVKLNRPGSEVLNENMPVKFWISLLIDGENYFLTGKRGASGHWIRSDGDDSELKHLVFVNQTAEKQSHEFLVDFNLGEKYSPSAAGILKIPVDGKVSPELLIADSIFHSKMQQPNGKIEKVIIGYQVGLDEVKIVETNWKNSLGIAPASKYENVERKVAFETLNKIRGITGVGYLKQHDILDKAAESHSNYVAINRNEPHIEGLGVHFEEPGFPGFTGKTAPDRAKYFGYEGNGIAEVMAGSQIATNAIYKIAGVPYHSKLIIGDYYYVGIGSPENSMKTILTDANLYPVFSSDFVALFPCNGVKVNVQAQGYETPNPSVLNGKQDFGYSSIALVRRGQKLEVISWELRDEEGNLVPTVLMTSENDRFKYFGKNEASLIPLNPLPRKAANYTTILKGKNNGSNFEKICRWSTVVGNTIP